MKKILVLAFAAVMLAFCLASCNGQGDYIDYSATDVVKEGYITLGNYKNVVLDYSDVSDAEIEAKVRDLARDEQYDTLVAGRPVEMGDIVNINYVGKVDGEEFEGGSAEDQLVFVGAGDFIDGFEDGIVGMNAGETKTIDVTFPEDYGSADLAGKAAQFDITLNIVYDPTIRTIAEAQALSAKLDEAKNMDAEELASTAWSTVVSEATVNKYPEPLLTKLSEEMYTTTVNQWMNMFGLATIQELYDLGLTEEYLRSSAKAEAEATIKEELVVYAIAQAEGFTVSKDEYNAKVKDLAAYTGYTEAEVRKYFTAQSIETKVLYDEVTAFVAAGAKIVAE